MLNEFGHQTHVASRPVSVFGAFHGENPTKFVRSRKIKKSCRHDGPGDACVWKKFGGPPAESEKKTHYGADFLHIRSVPVTQVVRGGMHEMSPNFGRHWDGHRRAPRKIRTNSGSTRTLRHTRSVFSVRFTEKTCTHDGPIDAGVWKKFVHVKKQNYIKE